MGQQSFITPGIETCIRQEIIFSSVKEIGRASIDRFVLASGDNNHLYWDGEFAKKTCYGSFIAPLAIMFELNQNLVYSRVKSVKEIHSCPNEVFKKAYFGHQNESIKKAEPGSLF
jgi:hypothetical protein